jgi:16S rRNA (uracil1498-N3)-methyltransferase
MSIFLMPRFFVGTPLNPDDLMQLPDDVVRHILVLRLQPGDSIVLFNGEGGEYSAELVEVERRSASVRIREFRAIEVEAPYHLTLAQGIASGDKMDWLIEKAVELGASCFVPLTTTRSVVRLSGERAQRRHAHWQGIVRASCEQCGRNRLPEVMPVAKSRRGSVRCPANLKKANCVFCCRRARASVLRRCPLRRRAVA